MTVPWYVPKEEKDKMNEVNSVASLSRLKSMAIVKLQVRNYIMLKVLTPIPNLTGGTFT